MEFLNQPIVANPSDKLRFQALSGTGSTATGIDGGLDAFIVYSEKDSTDYIGVGKTVIDTNGTTIFISETYPSVIQSIKLCNYSLNNDIDASVSIASSTGVTLGYLTYNLTVPKNAVIEILEKPKNIGIGESIVANCPSTGVLSVTVSGKYIV